MAYSLLTPAQVGLQNGGQFYYGRYIKQEIQVYGPANFPNPAQGGRYPWIAAVHGGGWNTGQIDDFLLDPIFTNGVLLDEGNFDVLVVNINMRQNTYATEGPPITTDPGTVEDPNPQYTNDWFPDFTTALNSSVAATKSEKPAMRGYAGEDIDDCKAGVQAFKDLAIELFNADPENGFGFGGSAACQRVVNMTWGPSPPFGPETQFNSSSELKGMALFDPIGAWADLDSSGQTLAANAFYNQLGTTFEALPVSRRGLDYDALDVIRRSPYSGKPATCRINAAYELPLAPRGVHHQNHYYQIETLVQAKGGATSRQEGDQLDTATAAAVWADIKSMMQNMFTGTAIPQPV